MATESQLNANRENARHSTGPRTDEGKAASSRNHTTLGLYTRNDFVLPEDREFYHLFCDKIYLELSPEGILEETLVAEITGASWRLRRCALAEASLAADAECDPMLDEALEKKLRSIDRARAAAQSTLHRSIDQLRKIQTQRQIGFELSGVEIQGLADFAKVNDAIHKQHKSDRAAAKTGSTLSMADLERLTAPPRAA